MTEEEFNQWLKEGDKRVGRCPFCRMPGWITGDDNWCEHYAGTRDIFQGSEAYFPFVGGEPFKEFITLISAFNDLPENKKSSFLQKMAIPQRSILEIATHLINPEEFWINPVRHRELSVDVDESLFSTTYISYFIKNPILQSDRLAKKIKQIIPRLQQLMN